MPFLRLRKKSSSSNKQKSRSSSDGKNPKNHAARKLTESSSSSNDPISPKHSKGPLHLHHKPPEKAPTPGGSKQKRGVGRNSSSRTAATAELSHCISTSPAKISPSPDEKGAAPPDPRALSKGSSEASLRRIATGPISAPPEPLVPEEADPLVQTALMQKKEMISDEGKEQLTLAVKALDQAGNALFQAGDYDGAFLRYERSLWLKHRTLEDDVCSPKKEGSRHKSVLASVATSINNMTYLKQKRGQASTAESMASYVKSLQIKREILGPEHLSVGKTLNNIGSVFYLNKEYEGAMSAYRDAHKILQKHLGDEHLDVVTVISNIADVYAAMGDNEKALADYRKALALRWSQLGSQDPKVIRLMEQVARLETGEQPRLRLEAESEFGFVPLEEQRHEAVFMDDLKHLQEELDDDMAYFDLVERQMAIDMLKDRTQMLREMRRMIEEQDAENEAARKNLEALLTMSGQLAEPSEDSDEEEEIELSHPNRKPSQHADEAPTAMNNHEPDANDRDKPVPEGQIGQHKPEHEDSKLASEADEATRERTTGEVIHPPANNESHQQHVQTQPETKATSDRVSASLVSNDATDVSMVEDTLEAEKSVHEEVDDDSSVDVLKNNPFGEYHLPSLDEFLNDHESSRDQTPVETAPTPEAKYTPTCPDKAEVLSGVGPTDGKTAEVETCEQEVDTQVPSEPLNRDDDETLGVDDSKHCAPAKYCREVDTSGGGAHKHDGEETVSTIVVVDKTLRRHSDFFDGAIDSSLSRIQDGKAELDRSDVDMSESASLALDSTEVNTSCAESLDNSGTRLLESARDLENAQTRESNRARRVGSSTKRATALVSVRARLEHLRAKRGLQNITIPAKHRHYMDQTASSVAKAAPMKKPSVAGQNIRERAMKRAAQASTDSK